MSDITVQTAMASSDTSAKPGVCVSMGDIANKSAGGAARVSAGVIANQTASDTSAKSGAAHITVTVIANQTASDTSAKSGAAHISVGVISNQTASPDITLGQLVSMQTTLPRMLPTRAIIYEMCTVSTQRLPKRKKAS